MALGITDLVNNIKDSVKGLVDQLQGKKPPKQNFYHEGEAPFKNIQSQITKSNWSKLNFPYTFAVININKPTDTGGFAAFELPLAPQSINQREEPAISIKASQGGTTVNHSGLGYKVLSIQGTTGIAPFRGEGGVENSTGEAIFQPKDLKHKSGYEVFLHLRNWFRTYYEFKKVKKANGRPYRLLFKNYKDGEFLIIELLSFEMDRQATRPFLYDYKLEFKVLSHYQFKLPGADSSPLAAIESRLNSALDKIKTARGVFLRTQGILRQIEATYEASVLEPMRQTTLAIKALLGIPLVAADIGSRVLVNTVSTAGALAIATNELLNTATLGLTGDSDTLAEVNSLTDKRLFGSTNTLKNTFNASITEIKQKGAFGLTKLGALMTNIDIGQFPEKAINATLAEQATLLANPRVFYEKTRDDLERVAQNAEDFFNLGSTTYDTLFDRTATLNADIGKTVTNDEFDLLHGFNEAVQGINLLLSTTDLFKSSFDSRVNDIVSRFGGNISLQANPAAKQVTISKGMTLERLALNELGDTSRWGEIVEANNLKAPYISNDPKESREGVLRPGSKVLIPVPIESGFSEAPQGKENKLSLNMNEIERSLGIDFKVDENLDLMITSAGDLNLIAGQENMAQAVILKLSYEPGDLMNYPEIGSGLIIGTKFPTLDTLKDQVTNSLLQDPRVSKVTDLSLIQDGSALYVNFNVYIKNVDLPIPIKILV